MCLREREREKKTHTFARLHAVLHAYVYILAQDVLLFYQSISIKPNGVFARSFVRSMPLGPESCSMASSKSRHRADFCGQLHKRFSKTAINTPKPFIWHGTWNQLQFSPWFIANLPNCNVYWLANESTEVIYKSVCK